MLERIKFLCTLKVTYFNIYLGLTSLVFSIATMKSKNASKPAVCPGEESWTWTEDLKENVKINKIIYYLMLTQTTIFQVILQMIQM